MFTYLKHVRTELSHVAWPSTRTAIAHTLTVILIATIVGLYVGLLDYVFTGFVGQFLGA